MSDGLFYTGIHLTTAGGATLAVAVTEEIQINPGYGSNSQDDLWLGIAAVTLALSIPMIIIGNLRDDSCELDVDGQQARRDP